MTYQYQFFHAKRTISKVFITSNSILQVTKIKSDGYYFWQKFQGFLNSYLSQS